MPSLVIEHDSADSAKAAVQGWYQAQRLIQISLSPQIRGKIKLLFVKCKLPEPPVPAALGITKKVCGCRKAMPYATRTRDDFGSMAASTQYAERWAVL